MFTCEKEECTEYIIYIILLSLCFHSPWSYDATKCSATNDVSKIDGIFIVSEVDKY